MGKAGAAKAFVFRKASSGDASRDGFENSLPGNSLSRSGAIAGAAAASPSSSSGATSFSGLSSFLGVRQQSSGSGSGASAALSSSAPLAGFKRTNSSVAGRSCYEQQEENSQSGGGGSALFNRLKKAKV
jgi:hypothetical protein